MTHTQRKEQAQDRLMSAIGIAFFNDSAFDGTDEHGRTLPMSKETRAEMDKQMKRIEKLFGYKQGSWRRGV